MIDIINAYVKAGFECVLLTGRLNLRNTPLNPAARIEKIIKYNRVTAFSRIWTWVIGFFQILIKVVLEFRQSTLFIVSNPPLAPLIPLFVKNRFSLLIFDVYPDALTELGYLSEKSFFIRLWGRINKKVFAKADNIFTISESMKSLLSNYTDNETVKVVPVWTDNALKPVEASENPFLQKHGLIGKFVVLYSGNIGLSGDVDVLVDIAARLKRDDLVFLIIGEGAKKSLIIKKVNELDLKNVIILPWQIPAELPYSLSSASLAVVSLGAKASKLAVPSKLFNYFSVGAPILCLTSKGSEVEKLVTRYECGKSFEPDDVGAMVKFINEIAEDKELYSTMRNNSLKASADFNCSNVQFFLD